ncbi:MAG: hypothetical protein JW807_15000 [Spirochaetes bacterium]|nr:hypothetical protein [Spirochaetota bacterium]
MFEKIKLIMTLVFTLCFLSYSVLIGKYYERISLSRSTWVVVCVVITVAVAVVFIIDLFFTKHPTDQTSSNRK